jgi:hypothetical protein
MMHNSPHTLATQPHPLWTRMSPETNRTAKGFVQPHLPLISMRLYLTRSARCRRHDRHGCEDSYGSSGGQQQSISNALGSNGWGGFHDISFIYQLCYTEQNVCILHYFALEKLYEGLTALLGGPFFGHQGSGVLGQALAADHASSLPSPGFPWSIREESDRQPESGTDQ